MGNLTVLIDTHVLLWMLTTPERLSTEARRLVERLDVLVRLSPVSLFEISTKVRLGKLERPGPLISQVSMTLLRLNIDLLPLSAEAAVLAGQLDFQHRDPFDRLLAAQAIAGRLPLVTADAVFHRLAGLQTVW